MTRYAFTFKIHPQMKKEYKEAHDKIWPEMVEAIRAGLGWQDRHGPA